MSETSFPAVDTEPGHRAYTPGLLKWYDLIVHGFSNRWLWHCPTARLQEWFDQHANENHLDIGVGTGFFLDRSKRLKPGQRIGLLDANPNCLAVAAKRIERLNPEVIQANLAEDFHDRADPFQSVSLMYVLHCLPGDVDFRSQVIDHAAAILLPGGTLFGATILGEPKPKGWLGRRVMASYNQKGIFGNQQDTQSSLEDVLAKVLQDVQIEQVGSVALFAGRTAT
ncbi:methyltransferase domain-containing protein [bacterium]|nr:methyltransferase domain-containing protein [bacterium]